MAMILFVVWDRALIGSVGPQPPVVLFHDPCPRGRPDLLGQLGAHIAHGVGRSGFCDDLHGADIQGLQRQLSTLWRQ